MTLPREYTKACKILRKQASLKPFMILSPLNVFDHLPIFTQLQLLNMKNKSLHLQSKHLLLTQNTLEN